MMNSPSYLKTDIERLLWFVFESLYKNETFQQLQIKLENIINEYERHPYNSRQEVAMHLKGKGMTGVCHIWNITPDEQCNVSSNNYVHAIAFDLSKELYRNALDFAKSIARDTSGNLTSFTWRKSSVFGLDGILTHEDTTVRIKFESSFFGERIVKFQRNDFTYDDNAIKFVYKNP